MRKAYVISDSIVSSLGFSTAECMDAIENGVTGLESFTGDMPDVEPFITSRVDDEQMKHAAEKYGINMRKYTRLELMALISIYGAVGNLDLSDARTLFILSTTKGNIELLGQNMDDPRLHLWSSAQVLADHFVNPNKPLVISNACISGIVALIVASRILEDAKYERVVVVGVDTLTKFVISGFQSFKALSPELCRPFDTNRCGLNVGEGAATVILGASSTTKGKITIEAGAVTNDANHISGPSRTAEGLFLALEQIKGTTMPDFINAHGTATPYNDEMEAIAIGRSGLTDVPVNSLKGYIGHTLGAAGVIESALCVESMRRGVIPVSLGFSAPGVSVPLNVVTKKVEKDITQVIKTASGFGGCNAAIRFAKF